jgi:hypothetical protein
MTASFKGGEKLEAKLKELMHAVAPEAGRAVRVGFLEGSTCGKNNSASAPEIAFFNEYGTIGRQALESMKDGAKPNHIPPRPFFRTMISKNSPRWGKLLEACLKHQHYSVQLALAEAGLKMHEQLQQSIEEFTTPGNAPSTIAAKGFDAPLQDSKNMKRAIWFEVVEGGAE